MSMFGVPEQRGPSLAGGKNYMKSSAFWAQRVIPQVMGNKDGCLHFVLSLQAADWNRIYSFLECNLLEFKIIDFILKLNVVFPDNSTEKDLLALTIMVQNYSISLKKF